MLPESGKSLPTASALMLAARNATAALVEREEIRTGSRMVAYSVVASMIGRSESWVRKFLGGCPSVKPDILAWLNIKSQYEHLCQRIEQDTATRKAKLNAIAQSIDRLDQNTVCRMADQEKDEGVEWAYRLKTQKSIKPPG